MNGYDENPTLWEETVWRIRYGEDIPLLLYGVHLADAIREANRNERPKSVQFYDKDWLNCTQAGIRRAMQEVARDGGMSGAIAA
jgi:glucuronate isomerase